MSTQDWHFARYTCDACGVQKDSESVFGADRPKVPLGWSIGWLAWDLCDACVLDVRKFLREKQVARSVSLPESAETK